MFSNVKISKNAASVYDRTFFTRDKSFYSTLFHLMAVLVLQNVVTYSVTMADNMMLGNYSQTALSGAATANMVFFLFNSCVLQMSEGAVIIGSQYWGQQKAEPIRKVIWTAIRVNFIFALLVTLVLGLFPGQIIDIFTNDPDIIASGVSYLGLMKFTYPIYAISVVMMATNRIVGSVNITLYVSIVSLVVNVGINYILIFGKFGMPEMGLTGAAVGTLIARIIELILLTVYNAFKDKKLRLFSVSPLARDSQLTKDYLRTAIPIAFSALVWSLATPIQTGILGNLKPDSVAADAIAANSASTTLYQYLKVITSGEAAASIVISGRAVGEGDMSKVRSYTRTLQILYLGIGLILSVALYFVRIPVLSIYTLTPSAYKMADSLLVLLCFIMAGMAYQMPTGYGIMKGGGDTRFILIMNIICSWCIVVPLAFMAAFWWHWSALAIVFILNSDQIFKAIPIFFRTNSYKWVHHLTR